MESRPKPKFVPLITISNIALRRDLQKWRFQEVIVDPTPRIVSTMEGWQRQKPVDRISGIEEFKG